MNGLEHVAGTRLVEIGYAIPQDRSGSWNLEGLWQTWLFSAKQHKLAILPHISQPWDSSTGVTSGSFASIYSRTACLVSAFHSHLQESLFQGILSGDVLLLEQSEAQE
jgi:hypothetical protein